jgi:hypothetical protein
MEQIVRLIPHWLAWPLNLASTLAGLTGAGFVLYGAGFADGDLTPYVWAAVSFVVAAVLWFVADLASSNRSAEI